MSNWGRTHFVQVQILINSKEYIYFYYSLDYKIQTILAQNEYVPNCSKIVKFTHLFLNFPSLNNLVDKIA